MKVRIGDAEIDFDRMTARTSDTVRNLTRQPLEILRNLISANGDIVTKDRLVETVWNGRIITDATLSTAIKEARRAVGDNGSAQHLIETVHGVGFRLIAPVKRPEVKSGSHVALPCVVVLPFRNTSPDVDAQFVCDGMTDDIIAELSRFRDLRVLSRTTSDVISAAQLDPAEILDRYDAHFVIEGSLRLTPTRLRVSVQLTASDTGAIVVTEQFDREATAESLFDLQEQIARICVGRLAGPHGPVALAAAESARTRTEETSWDMYRLVSDFRRFYRTYDTALHAELRAAFPAALERTPGSSSGWAAYAVLLLEEFRYHVNEREGVDSLGAATQAAQRAVQADNRNAFAQVALAMCSLFAMDVARFDQAANRALALNPGNSDVLSEIGHCYAFLGREEDAIRLLDEAMEISPEHPGWYHFAKTWRYARLGMYDAALLEVQMVPTPGFYWYHAHLVWLFSAVGQSGQAKAEAAILREVFPGFEAAVMQELALWEANADLKDSALAHWRKAGLVIPDEAGGW